jgi:hypothetical protein
MYSVAPTTPYVILGHELMHAYRFLRYAATIGNGNNEFEDPQGNKFIEKGSPEEMTTVGLTTPSYELTENLIRAEHRLGLRAAYASPFESLDRQGVTPQSNQPSWWPNYPVPQ